MRTQWLARVFSITFVLALLGSAVGQAPIGWRTDGTGRYPKADPPIAWGLDKNVFWVKKMPGQSNAIPVILGDKIFTCSEPCILLCVNKADGEILWQKESSYKELALTDDEKAQMADERQQAALLGKQQSVVSKELSALNKMVKDGTTTKEEAAKKIDELTAKAKELQAQRQKLVVLNRYSEPGKDSTGGFTSPTPVTDGKRVYVMFGNGLVACYDLDGNRQWLKLIEHSTVAYGHGTSPLLVGDKLLVHFADLVALNTKDGSEAWRKKIPPNHGTPIHANIDNVDVAITPTGYMVRVDDGSILTNKLGSCGPNSPLVQDGTIYYVAGQARGYALPTSLDNLDKWKPLWQTSLQGGGYWFPSPILHDGLIYGLNASAIFSVVDVKSGKKVYDQRLELGGGQCYPSITLAGKYLYASSDNGTTVILEPGREYKEIARNSLETFRSSPVFEGKRMYVRTVKNLWCIGE